jgi:hypothetical protein
MQAAPTWIDERMVEVWRGGDRVRHYTGADRWIVYPNESSTAFVVLATNGDQSWIGGDDTSYPAFEVAAAIERWSTIRAGLNECLEFIDALDRNLQLAEAKGARQEIIRAKYLLDAMRARVAIAHAEDAPPFTGYAVHQPVDDAETATLIIPWEADDDSPA